MPSFIDFVYAALLLAAAVSFIFNILVIPWIVSCGIKELDKLLNPSVIYRRGRVNKFGTILATIFHTIFFFPHAIWFWIYKACTVGT